MNSIKEKVNIKWDCNGRLNMPVRCSELRKQRKCPSKRTGSNLSTIGPEDYEQGMTVKVIPRGIEES